MSLMRRLIVVLLAVLFAVPGTGYAEPPAADSGRLVGWLEISGQLREGPVPFAWVSESEAGPSVEGVVAQLDFVAGSDDHAGLVVYLDSPALSLQQIERLGRAVDRVREAGKTVVAFSETYSTGGYLLATRADLIVMQKYGMMMLQGLMSEEIYLAGLLERIGVEADLLQLGRFKGAAESMTRREPTPFWDENIDGLLDDLYAQIVEGIAERRGLSVDQVEAVMRDSWLLSDRQLVRRGILDAVTDRDMTAVLAEHFPKGFSWDKYLGQNVQQAPDNPFALFQMLFKQPKRQSDRPQIAVVHARGAIHMGDSSTSDGAFSDDSIGHRTMQHALRDARHDENVKGVIVRIDSPGGSALASEVIWQAVREAGQEKPVFVSVGSMAASGGYYIASAGDQIYVEPESIVGSIGVVSGKIHFGGMYDKLDIGVRVRSRGPMADMFASDRPFTPGQRHTMMAFMERVYEQFLERVRAGRGDRLPRVEAVAEGRLFTGRQAVENGMVDRVGGLDEAVAQMAERLDLGEGDFEILDMPEPMSFQEFMKEAFGVRSSDVFSSVVLQALLGERWSGVTTILQGALQLEREPALLLMPVVLEVRVGP
ncbi:signal peptide peptidase SppA [Mucisphaera calidilacus]|uniref:Protease 4 n=1 Tax=Mucisphaera calidilacus TaxID=2527982 RepID=A0A518BY50_9BACT|nr:signal peptide peptidase SppA [Mucisphaera calidilacus]QDU71909.1 Protease 4 [Mucisphaera calidilacus]